MFGFFNRTRANTQRTGGLRQRPEVEALEARDVMSAVVSPGAAAAPVHHAAAHDHAAHAFAHVGAAHAGESADALKLAGSPVTLAAIQHNLQQVNHYRSLVGAPALKLDLFLSAYAAKGSQELLADHLQHQHFNNTPIPGARSAETQSYVYGYPLNQPFNGETPARNVNEQIDKVLSEMWAEGPGGGHHDIMANPNFKFLGVGLVVNPNDLTDPTHPDIPGSYWHGALYLTNDFMS